MEISNSRRACNNRGTYKVEMASQARTAWKQVSFSFVCSEVLRFSGYNIDYRRADLSFYPCKSLAAWENASVGPILPRPSNWYKLPM